MTLQAPSLTQDSFTTYHQQLQEVLQQCCVTDQYEQALSLQEGNIRLQERFLKTKEQKGKALLLGNGGSLPTLCHMQRELQERAEMRATLFSHSFLFSSLGHAEEGLAAYEKQVQFWGEPRDFLFAISRSGSSEGILRATAAAQEMGMEVMTLTGGSSSNPLRQVGDLNFFLPTAHLGMIELAQATFCRYFTDLLSSQLPPVSLSPSKIRGGSLR